VIAIATSRIEMHVCGLETRPHTSQNEPETILTYASGAERERSVSAQERSGLLLIQGNTGAPAGSAREMQIHEKKPHANRS
jgi:hypothetical protein